MVLGWVLWIGGASVGMACFGWGVCAWFLLALCLLNVCFVLTRGDFCCCWMSVCQEKQREYEARATMEQEAVDVEWELAHSVAVASLNNLAVLLSEQGECKRNRTCLYSRLRACTAGFLFYVCRQCPHLLSFI